MLTFISKALTVILAFIQSLSGTFSFIQTPQRLWVDDSVTCQTFENFGTSSAWWAQTVDDEATAREIARALFDDETGLGLDVFRYNVGGGEADNPSTRIGDVRRRTESFYVLNSETGEYEYDFTRDANARRMLDFALEYGAQEVILFANSPHYSMTVSGQASGNLESGVDNLPKENYQTFVDYMLTIADWFVEQGYPVVAISPVNEPMWGWGGGWVGQEGCHYSPESMVEVLELFALTMQERGTPYRLAAYECGQMDANYYYYTEAFFNSRILNEYCEYLDGHSYWMDHNINGKAESRAWLDEKYPGKKIAMTEWCELPLVIDSNTVDSGINMARVIIEDLTLFNAVSWQSWTAVNGDGLMDFNADSTLRYYNRYYAFKHFTSFIKPGSVRVQLEDTYAEKSDIMSVAFKNGDETVIVVVNPNDGERKIHFGGVYSELERYTTDESKNCELTYSGKFKRQAVLSAKSINTFVLTENEG